MDFMKPYHKNPRFITEDQYANLKRWLKEYGDLSGIVHDLNSDQIIGGNQRSTVFNINQCKIVIRKTFDPPTKQGTVGYGDIFWKGHKYRYRQVRWSQEQCELANLIANKAGGSFDYDILANEFDLDVVLASGFARGELGMYSELPTLEELANEYGEPQVEDFWPSMILHLPPSLADRFYQLMKDQGKESDSDNFSALLDKVNETLSQESP